MAPAGRYYLMGMGESGMRSHMAYTVTIHTYDRSNSHLSQLMFSI